MKYNHRRWQADWEMEDFEDMSGYVHVPGEKIKEIIEWQIERAYKAGVMAFQGLSRDCMVTSLERVGTKLCIVFGETMMEENDNVYLVPRHAVDKIHKLTKND